MALKVRNGGNKMISYTATPDFYNEYISHHGIKGQKWGKRNGPPYPLGSDISTGKTLKKQFKSKKVEKGKTLKTKNNNLSVTESKMKKDLNPSTIKNPVTGEKISGARRPSPEDLDKQIKDASKKAKPDSKTVKLYKEAGMSQADAEAAALRKKKIALAVGITAGVTIAAVAGYAAYKHYQNPLKHDVKLKKGLELQTLSTFENRTSNGEAFFASTNKLDNAKYITLFGKDGKEYKSKIVNTLNKSSKIASVDSGQKIFDDLYKNNKQFKDRVDGSLTNGFSKTAMDHFNKMTNEDKYLTFNKNMVFRVQGKDDMPGQTHIAPQYEQFFEALKENGYSGFIDTNDIKGTKGTTRIGWGGIEVLEKGINTDAPIIFFDTDAITKKSISKLGADDYDLADKVISQYKSKEHLQKIVSDIGKNTLPSIGPLLAVTPVLLSRAYDSKVTGKSEEELKDIKEQSKKKK